MVFQMHCMAASWKYLQLRPGNSGLKSPRARRVNLVELADCDQGRSHDLSQPVGAIPVEEISGAGELVGAPHRGVDRHGHMLRPTLEWLGPGPDPAEIATIERIHRLEIVWVGIALVRLV